METDSLHLKELSPDQKLFAIIQNGVLKIYDVEANVLKQEYVPNLHLAAPCTALKWIKIAVEKKRKSQDLEQHQLSAGSLYILLGTSKGELSLYSYTTGKIEALFKGDGHSKSVSAIAHDGSNSIYTTGLDSQVIRWSIKKCKQESSFSSGPDKLTAICLTKNGIVTASKTIKVWNYKTNKLIQSFPGHSSDVIILKSFESDNSSDDFVLSASRNDRNLSLWKITEEGGEKTTTAYGNFTLLNNSPNYIDYSCNENNLRIACICRNESLSYFDVNFSSIKSKRPIKVKFTLEIASNATENATHIPIVCASIISPSYLIIGYGDLLLKFESISYQHDTKNVILLRENPMKKLNKNENTINGALNLVTPITDQNTEVLNTVSAKKRLQRAIEIPLGVRFDNLSVGASSQPNAKKLTHQLIQGLHGSDANILRNVLRQSDEETVRQTVKYLPCQYVMSFVNELSLLMSKKTAGSETALIWLRNLIQIHASSLMAYGHIHLMNTFGVTLGIIDHRTQNLQNLMRLRGRMDLLVGQLKQTSDIETEIHNENLLVYEDSDDESINLDKKSQSSIDDIYDDFDDEEDEENINGQTKITKRKIAESYGNDSEITDDDDDDDEGGNEMDLS